MRQEHRITVRDPELGVEAYRLLGTPRPFPPHFHDYYVAGCVERGTRRMVCQGRVWTLRPGDLVLFQPGEVHACVQTGGEPFGYRGLNLPSAVVRRLAETLTGRRELPAFSAPVLTDAEALRLLRTLHRLVMAGEPGPRKHELLRLLMERLLRLRGRRGPEEPSIGREDVEQVCRWLECHYQERLELADLCRQAHLSKSALLRAFSQTKGVTPYRYLESLRVGAARKLLERGVPPAEAALRTGFADQSHLTRAFGRFLGVTPGAYQEGLSPAKPKKRG